MGIYDINGVTPDTVYNHMGEQLNQCYKIDGTVIDTGPSDYDEWYTDYQHSILNARDDWKTQYRADNTVIPIILHTDEHEHLSISDTFANGLFAYLNLAIMWTELSACIGLGDIDMYYSNYQNTFYLLEKIPADKQINIWGNHDLWNFTDESGTQFVTDWDTFYLDNSAYTGHIYGKKYNECHIDSAHKVKYICIAGWEIDKTKGGHSYYNITQQSMDDVIDMLEQKDSCDIVILTHCAPFRHSSVYNYIESGDTLYNEPVFVSADGALTDTVITNVFLDDMLAARNAKTSGTITDSYGNTHSYDFTNCTGDIICCLCGHGHSDKFGYSVNGGILTIMYDAFAYGKNPFYMINIDRTNKIVDGWKVTSDAVVQKYSIPLEEPT